MPPSPITATVAPGHTFAVCIAAPTPVDTPHPSRHARSRGMPSGSGIACAACTTVRVASVPHARTPPSGAPSRARRSLGAWIHAWEQRLGTPRRHDRHVPHGTAHDRTTRSPGWRWPPRRRPARRCLRLRARAASGTASPSSRSRAPKVAVADAARHDPNLDLTGLRFVDQDRLDDDGPPASSTIAPTASLVITPRRSGGAPYTAPRGRRDPTRHRRPPLRRVRRRARGDGERRLRLVHAARCERDRRHVCRDSARTAGRSSAVRIRRATATHRSSGTW